ncbi:hypothetical protein TBLA_0H01810 [Henningerozyma blattae CBS 6284]|uniref:Uncharacterized protein n=1 Tax=Henningerozyma blattae (strain ATCC 34711 / CBS 6284 / DSM 70876 / NBRC 10599 / NRRL Y-10934 / UCD 77-7) TaxID=1071380 RepID=I2H7W6_HENB6|nr:hypothetical protein TBLA_0H01810 [Tetrapisispora blattae CBS 6284]CCH62468.1 hypothetical protein TBLA_0H01810 [Tetrapisispora blattae CBS 6284]
MLQLRFVRFDGLIRWNTFYNTFNKQAQFVRTYSNTLEKSTELDIVESKPTSNITLRDYQQHAIDSCLDSISNGTNRIAVSLATGGGKTVIFSNLIHQINNNSSNSQFFKALILVHRRELALQALRHLKKTLPEKSIQLELGKYICNPQEADIVIASIQSLTRRLDKYSPTIDTIPSRDNFDLIIIDEAHHSVADSYLKILNYLNPLKLIPIIGFSATFERMDKKGLSLNFDKVVYHKGLLEMIDDNWLCDVKYTSVNIDQLQLNSIETNSSTDQDFNVEQLSKIINTPQINQIILKTYKFKQKSHDLKSTLIFATDINHVLELHKLFQNNDFISNYVTGKTPLQLRDSIIQDFKQGKINILINCGIFTEGTDIPNIDSILLCRPTKSRSLLVQMIGRGLRLHTNKDFCHIIDFINTSNVGVISLPLLVGINVDTEYLSNQLDDVTLNELKTIKENYELQKLEQSLQLEKINQLENGRINTFIENTDAFNLTLVDYESLRDFSNNSKSSDNSNLEDEYIVKSSLPWVKFQKNGWGLSLGKTHHLRIYKDLKSKEYELKMYNDLQSFLDERDIYYSTKVKFQARSIKRSTNLIELIQKVSQIIENLSKVKDKYNDSIIIRRNLTKFAQWRFCDASLKQKSFIQYKLIKVFNSKQNKNYNLTIDDIKSYIKELKKGDASNIIFATSLAPIFPITSLLSAIAYKKRYKNKL